MPSCGRGGGGGGGQVNRSVYCVECFGFQRGHKTMPDWPPIREWEMQSNQVRDILA